MKPIRISAFFIVFSISAIALQSFGSTLASTVGSLSIENAHLVSSSNRARIYRGGTPHTSEINQLKKLKVSRVLIFKNDVKGEVASEIANLKAAGFSSKNVLHIPMPWKNLESFQEGCSMTLRALRFLEESDRQGENAFFHCTKGEDRTGMLAALWTLWSGENRTVYKAFQSEMCQRGYEKGNPNKPSAVVMEVRATLTPLFIQMVQLLAESRKNGLSLAQIKCPSQVSVAIAPPICQ